MLGIVGVLLAQQEPLADLIPHYGAQPPPFLPFGLRPLFVTQIDALRCIAERVVVALPAGFDPSPQDRRALAASGCTFHVVPAGANPEQALAALRMVLAPARRVVVLHGDAVPAGRSRGSDGAVLELENIDGFLSGACAPRLRLIGSADWALAGFVRADAACYYEAKVQAAGPRIFNAITIENDWVRKRADDRRRIVFETAWFRQVPSRLAEAVPAFDLDADGLSYRTRLIRLPLLSELLLHAGSPVRWDSILDACIWFLEGCHATRPPAWLDTEGLAQAFHAELIRRKSEERVEETCRQLRVKPAAGWSLNGRAMPSLSEIVVALIGMVPAGSTAEIGFWHGDFHFGNIFADRAGGGIRVIDPRGSFDGRSSCVFGDIRYDMAKLAHSVIGLYDLLLAGHFSLSRTGPTTLEFAINRQVALDLDGLQSAFLDRGVARHTFANDDVVALTALLFLTMPPLHHDRPDRQLAMVANGLRLAAALIGVGSRPTALHHAALPDFAQSARGQT